MVSIQEPNCSKRTCRHLLGVKHANGGQVVYCTAFPNGIPDEIAYGNDLHLAPHKAQANDIVFEPK